MKTQIIQLEAYDDNVSVRDKMGWGQTSRILLVWPAQGRPLERRLDLVLLQRHSLALGAQLGLVTHDGQVRANALELRLPVFSSLREAQTGRWRVGRRRRPRLWRKGLRPDLRSLRTSHLPGAPEHPALRMLLFALSLLALMALAAALLPGALIELQMPVSTQEITVPVTANQTARSVNLAGEVPAAWDSIVVEGRETSPTTGTVLVPEKPATGRITFTNLTEKAVAVPSGTVVSTLGEPVIRFATIQDGRVPGGVGRSAMIEVQAVAPGKAGNIGAKKLQAIEGPLGLQLSAVNTASTTGGTSLPAAGPSQDDKEEIYSSLLKNLEQTAVHELLSGWQADPVSASFPITGTLALVDTLEIAYTPDDVLPAEELELTLRLEFKMMVVEGKDLERLVTPLLDAALGPGQQAAPGTLTLRITSPVELTGSGLARWRLTAERQVKNVLTQGQVAGMASKLPAEQAAQTLVERLGLKASPQLQVWPKWWPYLPFLPARIEVLFK
jgi:hypothetical protein